MEVYMSRVLKYSVGFTFFCFILAHFSFYQKYIALFPSFSEVTYITHYHATLMFLWLALLVAQPILISTGNVQAHKIIGKATYLIAPMLIVSMFLITNQGYLSKIKRMSVVESFAGLSVNIPDFFAFALLFGLGIYFRKKTEWHSRFMLATLFPIFGAALVRILIRYFGMSPASAFNSVPYILDVMCLLFILAEFKTKTYQPYLITLGILLIEHLIWIGRYTDTWQSFAKWYVSIFIN